jgi:hypothetical protein
MKLNISYPFTQDWDYAYLVSSQGRNNVCLVKQGSKERTTISYARYLMSVHLKRYLTKDEHIDHINQEKIDDRIENLQILTQQQNNYKSAKHHGGRKYVLYQCPACLESFEKTHNQSHFVISKQSVCCSRECSYALKRNWHIEPKIIVIKQYSK